MLKALDESHGRSAIEALSFEERRGLLVDRELLDRDNRRLKTRPFDTSGQASSRTS